MSVPNDQMTPNPDTTISLEDFIEKATEEGCVVIEKNKETFVGEPGSSTGLAYPHIHVWRDETVALSIAPSRNVKIGKNGSIEISKLHDASTRYNISAGRIRNTIGWVLASAS